MTTLKRIKFGRDAEALTAKAAEFDAAALVFGLPLSLDGQRAGGMETAPKIGEHNGKV